MPSSEHERVYHAASRCQAASLPLTPRRLHDLKKACSVEGKKTGSFASQARAPLRRSVGMEALSRFKGGRVIGLVLVHHGENDARPHVGKGSDRHRMAFALSSLALIVVGGPALLLGRLPGKLVQGVTQRFDAAQPPVRFSVVAALKEDWRRPGQGLQAPRVGIACALIADFSEQARSKALACSGQTAEDLVVFMPQKKAFDLLIIGGDLLHQRQQLRDQCQHQARFRAGRDRIGGQLRLMQGLEDRGRDLLRSRMTSLLEHLGDLLNRSGQGHLWRGIAVQEDQGRVLLQLGKQLQGDRIVRFEAGGELIDQARLHLDQGVLVTREGFEFGHQIAIGRQPTQIGQVSSPRFGEQIGINEVGFGTAGGSVAIHGAWIHRVDGPSCLQQRGDEQAVVRFDDARHLLFLVGTSDGFQKGVQLGESFWRVIDSQRSSLVSLLVKHQGVMVRICPIDASIPHGAAPSLQVTFLSPRALILWCSKHDFLIIGFTQEHRQGSTSFLNRSSREEEVGFPRRVRQFI